MKARACSRRDGGDAASCRPRRALAALLAITLAGCSGSAAPPASASHVAPPAPPSATPAAALPSLKLTTVPRARIASDLRLEFDAPAFGDVLGAEFWRREQVRVRVVGASADVRVLVSVDGGRPRWLPPAGSLTLGELFPESTEPVVGAHELLAVAVSEQGQLLYAGPEVRPTFVRIGFFIGEKPVDPPLVDAPGLVCLSPFGTHYLAPKAPLRLEFLVLGAAPPALLTTTSARGTFRQVFDATQPSELAAAPLGDVRFRLDAGPSLRAECVVTINPSSEAPAP